MRPRPAAVIIGSVSTLVLASTFYAWRLSYFSLDDFNNLYWVQQQSLAGMLWYNVNPFTDFFRPLGMLVYWVFWHLFDLDPLPYHLFAWTLHAANVVLLYALLSRITGSRYGSAIGALLFAFRANFADIYWNFGTLFELLACQLMFLAVLIYAGTVKSRRLILVGVLYLLALKSKEMALTLPAVFFLWDVCLRRQKLDNDRKVWYAALAVLGIVYGYNRFLGMSSDSPTNPYYMDFSILTLGRGYGWYFDHLYGMRLRWGAWMIASVLIFGLFMYRRERRGLFFLGYIFITLVPVVFLVNHRYEFFWYVPFLGIAGLAAVAVDTVEKQLRVWIPARALEVAGLVLFAVLAMAHYVREKRTSAEILRNEQSLSKEYAAFVESLRNLPQPEPQGTVLIRSVPTHFTPEVLTSAVQVVLRRTDIRAEVVR